MKFKAANTEEERILESKRIREKYPDRVPCIVERGTERSSTELPEVDKKKYLCPTDLTVGQFMYVIRKRLRLPPEQAIYLFVSGNIPATGTLMSAVYEEHKDEDGFLYMTYSGENVFGCGAR